MTDEERRLQEDRLNLDRRLDEVEMSGGQVWVEANYGELRVLICHHIEPRGKLAMVSVMVPEARPRQVRFFTEIMKDHWRCKGTPTGGTIAGRDPGRPGETMSSYYGAFEPSPGADRDLGAREIEGIILGYAEDSQGRPFLKGPRIVLAEVVVKGEA